MFQKTVSILLLLTAALPAQAYDLSQHQWRDRLLILAADDPADATLRDKLEAVRQKQAGIEDRRLVVFQLSAHSGSVDGRTLSASDLSRLRKLLRIAPGQREMTLIGLDGGIKRRSDLGTDLEEIFAEIDRMPMRRAELDGRRALE